ncbi:MAG: hypothetical protein Fur0015_07790 [Ignavibacteriales bacterium]
MSNSIIKYKFGFYIFSFVCIVTAIAQTIITYKGFDIIIWEAIIDSMIYNALFWTLSFGLWYPIKYVRFAEQKISIFIINHIIIALITSILWTYSGYYFIHSLKYFTTKYFSFLESSLNWRILIGIFYYSITLAFFYLYIFYNDLKNKSEKEKELQIMVQQAEIKSLKYQINPHFIFNSLNSITSLITFDAEKAKEMTLMLSSYMRNIFTQKDTQFVKLEKELANIDLYLAIEKVRFENKFDYNKECDDECGNVSVPLMILQPIFENIVKHAVHETINKINIKFTCEIKDNFLFMKIQNDLEPDTMSKKGTGVGLENIANRLRLTYGVSDLFHYKKEIDKFTVEIKIPINYE